MQLLFLEPNPEYPANPTATAAYCANRDFFNSQVRVLEVQPRAPGGLTTRRLLGGQVRQVLHGGWFLDLDFPCHLDLRTLPSKRRSCESSFDSTHEELDSELGAMCLDQLESECLDQLDRWSPPRAKRRRSSTPSSAASLDARANAVHMPAIR